MNDKNEQSHSPDETLDEQALRYLERHGKTSAEALFCALGIANPSLTKAQVTDMIWRLADQSKIELRDVLPATKSVGDFLRCWERNFWLYVSLGLLLATVSVIYTISPDSSFVSLRWALGSLFALLIPGYAAGEALFPGRELDLIERLTLSVGLSIVLILLDGLMLDFSSWGITVDSVIISLCSLSAGLTFMAFARLYIAGKK